MRRIDCILMHRDLQVAFLTLDLDYGLISRSKALIPEHLPIGAVDTGALNAWWQRRAVPETQDFLRERLEAAAISNTCLLTQNLGLSLNDAYWICPIGLNLTWKDANLYENPFTDLPEKSGFSFSHDGSRWKLSREGSFFPGSSLQGNLKKRWIRKGNGTWLAKGNYRNRQQSLNERFATLLHRRQNTKVPFVEYELAELRFEGDMETGCISPNFTSPDLEFITARDILWSFGHRSAGEQTPQSYIDCLVRMGMEEEMAREGVWYQILTDYLMTNEDRHLRNFGILRNTATLKVIGLAPIFDTGNSMFWEGEIPENREELQKVRINRPERTEQALLAMAPGPDYVDYSRLPGRDEIISYYQKHGVREEKCAAIAQCFLWKKEALENHISEKGR